MARLPRLNIPDIPQHVIQRGNNREVCFFSDQDYAVYLDKLKGYSKKYGVAVLAYVLMTNHVHLLLTPVTERGVSQLMQALGRYYVRYINQRYQRTGTLWEGRFKSTLVDTETYFLTVSRYIELNPVRAAMVEQPAEYPWSSYHSNALGETVDLLTAHPCYRELGTTAIARQKAYLGLFEVNIGRKAIDEINVSTNKAWVLGSEHFKQQIAKQTGRRATPSGRGGDRKSKSYRDRTENQVL